MAQGSGLREWVKKNMGNYKDTDRTQFITDAVTGFHVSRTRAGVVIREESPDPIPGNPLSIPTPTERVMTEDQMRAKFDWLYKLRKAVAQLEPGKYWPEADFREMVAKVPGNKFRSVADLSEFDDYHGKEGGTTYWGHPESIAKLQNGWR